MTALPQALCTEAELAAIEAWAGRRAIVFLVDYLDEADTVYLCRCLRHLGREPVHLAFACRGGDAAAADRLWRQIQAHAGSYTVSLVGPAASAGTLIALGAHEILFTPHAYLTPIDPQIQHVAGGANGVRQVSSEELRRIPEMVRAWFGEEEAAARTSSLLAAAAAQMFVPSLVSAYRAAAFLERSAREALATHLPDEVAATIAHRLVQGYANHGASLLCAEAGALGLPARPLPPEADRLLGDLFFRHLDTLQRTSQSPRAVGVSAVLQARGFRAVRAGAWAIEEGAP